MKTSQINKTISCSATEPVQHTALVVEGGGQRGIFTAGILDSWLSQDFNPFSLLIGTSAGAQNLSTYMSKQLGHAKRSIIQLSNHPAFFNMRRSLAGNNIVDLDWFFNQVCDPEYQLNINCAKTQLKDRKLLFSATNRNTFSATFFEPTPDNWLTTLKASSALPYLYKKGIAIGEDYYVDGGIASPIPIQEAYQRGAKKIIVLRTIPANQSIGSPWAHKLKSWICPTKSCPKMLEIITEHENAYNEALDFIKKPPADAEIIEIAPPKKLASRLLGSTHQALNEDYQMGFEIGTQFLSTPQAQLFKTH